MAGFWFHSLPALFAASLPSGTVSALFGPIKYGILPDYLAREQLPAGNALVEAREFPRGTGTPARAQWCCGAWPW